ncbi:MAG: hypothetical protein R2836_00615 [Chitinophagales bacterium]
MERLKLPKDAIVVAHRVGYPVLVRPSYVLGGQRMKIVINDDELFTAVIKILKHRTTIYLMNHFLDRAKEAEVNTLYANGEQVHNGCNGTYRTYLGIHSVDSNAVLPPFTLGRFSY